MAAGTVTRRRPAVAAGGGAPPAFRTSWSRMFPGHSLGMAPTVNAMRCKGIGARVEQPATAAPPAG